MIILLAILSSLILIILGVIATFSILLFNRISRLLVVNGAYQAEEYRQAVAVQKSKKPSLNPVKEQIRGRQVVRADDLVDIADLPWEDGYKAVEELGNG